ncbi:hypothetical protein JCM9533A_54520 [Catenuloplanes niger JCM 9533]|uniref:FtsK domain-containing protein n=1 Tax=Catenuloplanes niger TaxID=587534 RepID=A0AAE3ZPT3_9ACTN|nr:FtsK/SpoIIIE domain-containing protein [Catenuloplanes niger]MDR7323823.1 hypothetical protein [Catenuloplanes niger]
MADDETDVSRAAALHRQAAAVLAAADAGLHALTPAPADLQAQRGLAERLAAAAAMLVPGWLGANLATGQVPPESPAGRPAFVRVGTARPLPEAGFPAVVPLAGTGHLTVDADGRDPRTAALLRAVLLRLLASTEPGSLLVRAVDGADDAVFAPFAALAEAGLMPPPVTDPEGLRAVLAEAEQWLRLRAPRLPDSRKPDTPGTHPRTQSAPAPHPQDTHTHSTHTHSTHVQNAPTHDTPTQDTHLPEHRVLAPRGLESRHTDARRPEQRKREQRRDDKRLFLLVVSSFPAGAEPVDLLRFRELAARGPEAGLHLLVAGWPPPALATGLPAQPLPLSTPITLREAYAIVGDPPGASFAAQPNDVGLNSPVLLDGDPPAEMLAAVCRRLASGFLAFERPSLREVLPAELWAEDGTEGLVTVVGRDGERTVTVQLTDLAPHWLIGGRRSSGKSAFLTAALAGLTARYSPDDLTLFVIDGPSGTQTSGTHTSSNHTNAGGGTHTSGSAARTAGGDSAPHLRHVDGDAERILHRLTQELNRRAALAARHGTTRFADLRTALATEARQRAHARPKDTARRDSGPQETNPRIVCVIDEFVPLLQARPELLEPLTAISRGARSCGIHLVLTSRSPRAIPALHERDGLFAQWTVRIALPGGGDVLEPTNESAQSLPAGTAVVNTAGGLGGPRNATRGHERLVRFPNPDADHKALSELHSRLNAALPRPRTTQPNRPEQPNPPEQQERPEQRDRPATPSVEVLLGRPVSARSTGTPPPPVAFPLDAAPGRHLAIIGAAPQAPDLLHAATRSVSAHLAPGTARFLVCTLVPDADRHAAALTAALVRRHEVEHLDAAGLTKALELEEPAYLVVFGLDAGDRVTLPPDRLTRLLRTGPANGVHLLSWWRGAHRLTGDLSAAAAEISGLALLDLPADEIDHLIGGGSEPAGALLHDRRSGISTPFIPFRTEPKQHVLPAPRSTARPAEARET